MKLESILLNKIPNHEKICRITIILNCIPFEICRNFKVIEFYQNDPNPAETLFSSSGKFLGVNSNSFSQNFFTDVFTPK